MNNNYICVYDYETGGKFANKSQPIQIAAIIIDPKKLSVVDGGEFESLMRPIADKDCEVFGVEPIQDEALKVNHKTRTELKNAPDAKAVFKKFNEWLANFNIGSNDWGLPVRAGFNIHNFDDKITERLACGQKTGEKEPYNFGPNDEFGAKVFHPIHSIDVMNMFFNFTEGWYNPELRSLSMDNIRKYTGMKSDKAHDALQDCYDCGELLVRMLRLHRNIMKGGLGSKINFENTCETRILNKHT